MHISTPTALLPLFTILTTLTATSLAAPINPSLSLTTLHGKRALEGLENFQGFEGEVDTSLAGYETESEINDYDDEVDDDNEADFAFAVNESDEDTAEDASLETDKTEGDVGTERDGDLEPFEKEDGAKIEVRGDAGVVSDEDEVGFEGSEGFEYEDVDLTLEGYKLDGGEAE